MNLKFLGAARQVTGSCYYLEAGGLNLLVDCGMFQEREFRKRNWEPSPVPPRAIDFVLLTHSHLDHAGLIPKLVKEGFSGPVLTTAPSGELYKIVLLDSARIQEEDAAYKKKRHLREGRKGPYPEVPLYTVADAEKSFPLLSVVGYESPLQLNERVSVIYHDAGHILGAAMVEIHVRENGATKKIVFSGDIGQWDKPLVEDPSVFKDVDYLIMESTYGNRNHEHPEDVEKMLCEVINETISAGGNIVIPTFAIERAQELMFHLSRLVRENKIPFIKIFLDSPMAVDVTDVFRRYRDYLDEETLGMFADGEPPFRFPGLKLVRTREESKAINQVKESCIIMAGSGMCTGGRIKHHLVQNISRPQSTILFVGFQAYGTLGRIILNGAEQVRIHGHMHNVRAQIEQIQGFSAHADKDALLRWLGYLKSAPQQLFLTHGEEAAALALADTIFEKFNWKAEVPAYLDEFVLGVEEQTSPESGGPSKP